LLLSVFVAIFLRTAYNKTMYLLLFYKLKKE